MTQFDTSKLRWMESHGDGSTSYRIHLETSILGYDREAGTIDFLLRFDDNGGHCPAHRHVTTTSVFVLEGEQHRQRGLPQHAHRARQGGHPGPRTWLR